MATNKTQKVIADITNESNVINFDEIDVIEIENIVKEKKQSQPTVSIKKRINLNKALMNMLNSFEVQIGIYKGNVIMSFVMMNQSKQIHHIDILKGAGFIKGPGLSTILMSKGFEGKYLPEIHSNSETGVVEYLVLTPESKLLENLRKPRQPKQSEEPVDTHTNDMLEGLGV